MLLREVAYARPESLAEALALLQADDGARALAGGQTLINVMKARAGSPDALIDLHRLEELQGIDLAADGTLTIGAMTTYRAIVDASGLDNFPVVQAATKQVGDPSVRNRGTIGGSLAHNDPAADLTAVMAAQGRAQSLEAARKAADEAEARERLRRFFKK